MTASNKYRVVKKKKANQMEKDGLISIFNLAEKSNLIDLVELFCNRVAYECLAMFNFDGSMQKPQKSKALEKCIMSATANCPR